MNRGIEGTARITDLEQKGLPGRPGDQGEAWWWEEAASFFTRSTYELTLEVHLPGREPFEVRGKFKAPKKAERTNFGLTRASLSRGLELPVVADPDDPRKVEIDWDRFARDPGRTKALDSARINRQNEILKQQLEKKPKQQAKMWANNKMAAAAWAEAVRAGNLSREQFEESINLEVDSGRMDPADAEAARASLDG